MQENTDTISNTISHMDTDGNGRLSYEEFSHGLKKFCLSTTERCMRFSKFDVDGSGEVEWVEFASDFRRRVLTKKKKKKRQSQGPHYMDVTEDWVREQLRRDKPTLASADKSWEQTLHGAKIGQGDWTLTTPHLRHITLRTMPLLRFC